MSLIIKQHFHDYGTVINFHSRIVDKYSKMIKFLKQTQYFKNENVAKQKVNPIFPFADLGDVMMNIL